MENGSNTVGGARDEGDTMPPVTRLPMEVTLRIQLLQEKIKSTQLARDLSERTYRAQLQEHLQQSQALQQQIMQITEEVQRTYGVDLRTSEIDENGNVKVPSAMVPAKMPGR